MPDLVAVRVPPGPRVLELIEDVWREGHAVLPLPWRAPEPVVTAMIDALAPAVVLEAGSDDRLHTTRRRGQPLADGVALVLATSGSTGAPKGVELSRAALDASTRASIARLGCAPDEPWLCTLPLSHVAGLLTLLRSRALDADPVVHQRFDVAAVAKARAAWVSLVPTQLVRLLDAGVDLRRYRGILLGGAAPPPGLLERARDAGATITVSYGMTETCGGCVYDGRPLDGVEVAIGDDGRIRLRGDVVMRGYRSDIQRTAAVFHDGWFVTSDLGHWDGERLTVLGRADDVIVTGGENVAAPVVVMALRGLAGIADAAVVGRDDAEWGQVVAAVVVPTDPSAAPTLGQVRDALRDRLPAAALPRAMAVVDRLPRDGMGKLSAERLQQVLRQD